VKLVQLVASVGGAAVTWEATGSAKLTHISVSMLAPSVRLAQWASVDFMALTFVHRL
jgi:hypothetical protein